MTRLVLPLLLLQTLLAQGSPAQAMSFLPDFLSGAQTRAAKPDERKAGNRLLADKVVVKKAERRLYLVQGDRSFRTYPISLGTNPRGHKERQGDGRTPEGRYYLDSRNAASRFRKSLHVSYPGTRDRLWASRKGVDPGGMIMIHGQPRPNRYRELRELISQENWTQGCIAVSNDAIDEIWRYTRDGTPLDILP